MIDYLTWMRGQTGLRRGRKKGRGRMKKQKTKNKKPSSWKQNCGSYDNGRCHFPYMASLFHCLVSRGENEEKTRQVGAHKCGRAQCVHMHINTFGSQARWRIFTVSTYQCVNTRLEEVLCDRERRSNGDLKAKIWGMEIYFVAHLKIFIFFLTM